MTTTTTITKKTKPVMAVVVWHDAHADQHGSWMSEDDFNDNPYIVSSCGFILEGAKKNHVTVAQSLSNEGLIDNVLHIPQDMVVSITRLKHKD